MKVKFINENFGVSQKNGRPYHMVKVADPVTLENHTISVDSAYVQPPLNFKSGQEIEISGRLSTPFNQTQFLLTSAKAI